jgi:hypothetical protein
MVKLGVDVSGSEPENYKFEIVFDRAKSEATGIRI